MYVAPASQGVYGSVRYLLNTTPPGAAVPSFGPVTQSPFVTASPAYADLNGDGEADEIFNGVVAGEAGNFIRINSTPAGATTVRFSPPVSVELNAIFNVADFDNDGKPDLAGIAGDSDAVILINTTAPGASSVSFAPPVDIDTFPGAEIPAGFTPGTVIADFNGDGTPDGASDNRIVVQTFVPAELGRSDGVGTILPNAAGN
ncbi:MAG: FG-GAP repeat domain-containing protein [Panacagrimonas sp.]